VTRVQDSGILPYDLFHAIAGDPGIRGVDVLHGPLHIGNRHGEGALFHGLGYLAELLFKGFALGDVAAVDLADAQLRHTLDHQLEIPLTHLGLAGDDVATLDQPVQIDFLQSGQAGPECAEPALVRAQDVHSGRVSRKDLACRIKAQYGSGVQLRQKGHLTDILLRFPAQSDLAYQSYYAGPASDIDG